VGQRLGDGLTQLDKVIVGQIDQSERQVDSIKLGPLGDKKGSKEGTASKMRRRRSSRLNASLERQPEKLQRLS
jgi:hypothetical protein